MESQAAKRRKVMPAAKCPLPKAGTKSTVVCKPPMSEAYAVQPTTTSTVFSSEMQACYEDVHLIGKGSYGGWRECASA
jgi:hypothetical protein